MDVSQYRIVLVNLDPTIGSEIRKTRPCVIISPNEMNRNLNTIVVAPMTTKPKKYPTRVEVKHEDKTGWVIIDQIRVIDKQRVVNAYEFLAPSEILELKSVLKETFVD